MYIYIYNVYKLNYIHVGYIGDIPLLINICMTN